MGVSGREEPALSVAEKFLSDYTDDIKISNGSLIECWKTLNNPDGCLR